MSARPRLLLSIFVSLALAFAFSGVSIARPDARTVQIRDNCDPTSFNAALFPDACVREGGGLKFDTFIGQLMRKGEVSSWRFSPERLKLAAGGTITAINRGGEFHSFTEVAEFAGGCVPDINDLLGLSPAPECSDPASFGTFVPPGESLQTDPLEAGTHLFQCLIHPWQRTTAEVD